MTRLRVALATVIAAALLPGLGIFTQVASRPEILGPQDDPISSFERRVAPLREIVRGEHVVGYLAPPQVTDPVAHLYALRYALAPVQVLDDRNLSLVVADGLHDTQHLPPGLRVRRDFGEGLVLLERAP